MIEITVLSGKGGTGKTSITAALASIAESAVYCDNDVDAADLHLLFKPKVKEKYLFESGWNVIINSDTCKLCNICIKHCRFDAIYSDKNGGLQINPHKCEGCRLCERICPESAISSVKNNNNQWFVSDSRFGTLVHAEMGPGEENSGKLVSQVRKKAKEIALSENKKFVINDGPPGIGCTTIASLTGTNRVLLVIEPTKSALHDAFRLLELIHSFKIKAFAIINKYDINMELVRKIELFLNEKNIPILAYIPFDECMVESMTKGQTIVEHQVNSTSSELIKKAWEKISIL